MAQGDSGSNRNGWWFESINVSGAGLGTSEVAGDAKTLNGVAELDHIAVDYTKGGETNVTIRLEIRIDGTWYKARLTDASTNWTAQFSADTTHFVPVSGSGLGVYAPIPTGGADAVRCKYQFSGASDGTTALKVVLGGRAV